MFICKSLQFKPCFFITWSIWNFAYTYYSDDTIILWYAEAVMDLRGGLEYVLPVQYLFLNFNTLPTIQSSWNFAYMFKSNDTSILWYVQAVRDLWGGVLNSTLNNVQLVQILHTCIDSKTVHYYSNLKQW